MIQTHQLAYRYGAGAELRFPDVNLPQGGVLLLAVAYLLINLLVDVSYTFLDPRIKRHG